MAGEVVSSPVSSQPRSRRPRDVRSFAGPRERAARLVQLGRQMEPFPEEMRTDAHRVLGCTQRAWVVATMREDRVYFVADAESEITKGLGEGKRPHREGALLWARASAHTTPFPPTRSQPPDAVAVRPESGRGGGRVGRRPGVSAGGPGAGLGVPAALAGQRRAQHARVDEAAGPGAVAAPARLPHAEGDGGRHRGAGGVCRGAGQGEGEAATHAGASAVWVRVPRPCWSLPCMRVYGA